MDFLEFLKSSCHYSDVRFDMRDNKIFQWQTSIFTGFSLYELNDYEIRVDYCGSATGYTLQHYSADYKIYKNGSYTSYDLRDSGYGDLRLYYAGTLYGEAEYMKEKEENEKAEKEKMSSTSSSTSSSSSTSRDFSGGFWSWSSWLDGLTYALAFTFTIGLVLELISPWLILIGPGIMVLWAIMIITHDVFDDRRTSRSKRLAKKEEKRAKKEVIIKKQVKNTNKRKKKVIMVIRIILFLFVLAIVGYVSYYAFFGGGLKAMPIYQWFN